MCLKFVGSRNKVPLRENLRRWIRMWGVGLMLVWIPWLPLAQPASEVQPWMDGDDQPFRWAPMQEASRSLVLHLTDEIHYAFDTVNLRPHTVWQGKGLELYGPPYTHHKKPFLARKQGVELWGLPPLVPWFVEFDPGMATGKGVLYQQFRALHTVDARPTLMYDLFLPSQRTLRVQIQPRVEVMGGLSVVVQRFEISATDEPLTHFLLAEMGKVLQGDELARSSQAVLVKRDKDFIVTWHRGLEGLKLQSTEVDADYDEDFITEENTESGSESVRIQGKQSRAYLRIPPQSAAFKFETLTAVIDDLDSWGRLAGIILQDKILPQNPKPGSAEPMSRDQGKRLVADPEFPERKGGDASWVIEPFPVPAEADLLVGGMDWTSDGDLAICTWTGDVYLIKNATGPVAGATYHRFARGLNEPLGLKVHQDKIHVVQKNGLYRLEDVNSDGLADLYVCLNNSWGYTGNYHAYAFGPVIDDTGAFYVFTCGQRGRWDVPFVGWAMQISPDGNHLRGYASGLRVPNGVGFFGPDQDLFVADNQGNWVGTCKFSHVKEGHFYGFPSGQPAPREQYENPVSFTPPAVWLPRSLSPSASDFVEIKDDRFGPYKGQVIMGDFQKGHLMRIQMEKVNGEWQGAVWPFLKGFMGAVNRMVFGPDGHLYVGGCKRTWSTPAPMEYALERVSYTGELPFEVHSVQVQKTGFKLTFTQPVSVARAEDPENYIVTQFNYKYHQPYGSPEFDHEGNPDASTEIKVTGVDVSSDQRSVTLTLEGLKTGYVTSVRAYGLANEKRERLRNDTFYYTLNHFPE